MNNVMNTYGTRELSISHGSGSWLWDTEDNKYLDALSGIAVCGLGHAHPNITKAILEQSKKLVHCSNFFSTSKQ
ncbi:MAG: aspartate aminotransferase family protein, partial [Myxococcales bacterium]|nr:aspartate aminotransferase family protein [Myxococcales bacterium]